MKFHLGYILGLFAIALAGSAGYISVVGWGKLFAGEAVIVMIVMTVIESAKIITTIYLHRYGKKTIPKVKGKNKFFHFFKRLLSLRTYLVIGVMATMFLTSVGIYGFLTGAYQETANKMEIHEGEVSILAGKRDIFKDKIVDNSEIKEDKSYMIDNLVQQRMQQQTRLDSLLANEHWQNAKRTREALDETNNQIKKLTQDIDTIVARNSSLRDSVSSYQVQILELESTSEVTGEVGPLKYVSTLTGRPMNSIINWIVLIIIFIFDPMAISLVLASNKVFDLNSPRSDTSDDEPTEPPDDDPRLPVLFSGNEPLSGEMLEALDEVMLAQAKDEPDPDLMVDLDPEIASALDSFDKISGTDEPEKERFNPIIDSINEEDTTEEEGEIDETKGNENLDNELKKRIESLQKDKLPEEQIAENKEELRKTIEKKDAVVPTGEIKREDIKEIREEDRGYSVKVPPPKNTVERIGSNKEVRSDEPDRFVYKKGKK